MIFMNSYYKTKGYGLSNLDAQSVHTQHIQTKSMRKSACSADLHLKVTVMPLTRN